MPDLQLIQGNQNTLLLAHNYFREVFGETSAVAMDQLQVKFYDKRDGQILVTLRSFSTNIRLQHIMNTNLPPATVIREFKEALGQFYATIFHEHAQKLA